MFTIDDKTRLHDNDYTKGIMREQANQQFKTQKNVVKFPCHDIRIELLRPEDTYLECPQCHKKYLLSYSANRTKLWGA